MKTKAPRLKSRRKKMNWVERSRYRKDMLERLGQVDLKWVPPLAHQVRLAAPVLSRFIAEVLARVAAHHIDLSPFLSSKMRFAKQVARVFAPKAEGMLSHVEEVVVGVEKSFGLFSHDVLSDVKKMSATIAPVIESVAKTIEENPRLVLLLKNPDIIRETFGEMGETLAKFFNIVPALSTKAADSLPEFKEALFAALYSLPDEDEAALYALSESILNQVFQEFVFPRLSELLAMDPRSKVLAPILFGATESIPGQSCLNALLNIACTPREELSTGRMVTIAIQELGGLFVKVSQVIADLCPPGLARELRANQDDAGGLFPSQERSWNYVRDMLMTPELLEWRQLIEIPENTITHFASASVGAVYELELTQAGQLRFGTKTVLIKIQRPGLEELLNEQAAKLLQLCDKAELFVTDDKKLPADTIAELLGILNAVRRAILNYHKQSSGELDFRQEKVNATRVREALAGRHPIRIPMHYYAGPKLLIMERMSGTKVTRIVQTRYLERRKISDTIARAYLELLFEQGVVWADPHAGNILFDDLTLQASMIDLNPCFMWDEKTRHEFKFLLYRLTLRDVDGVFSALPALTENPESLLNPKVKRDLLGFVNQPLGTGTLTRFVGEFIKTLSENKVDLKIEVQAALRGLSQIALTTSAVSMRNNFGVILQNHFGVRELVGAVWQVGIFRTARVLFGLTFEIVSQLPEEDVGPVLDERDIAALEYRLRELSKVGVCDVEIRRVSPDEQPNLKLSADGSVLLITSDLRVEVIDKARPATVRYFIEVPPKRWLRDRQEFVKLSSIARNFCIVECLEQLRRNSLDDYWRIVEAWNKPPMSRTIQEIKLVGNVRTAARRLYALRFSDIWNAPIIGIPKGARRVWRWLLMAEARREETEQKYLGSIKHEEGDVILGSIAYSTFYRVKMVFLEMLLWFLRYQTRRNRFSMHLLPMTTKHLEELILFGLSRHFSIK